MILHHIWRKLLPEMWNAEVLRKTPDNTKQVLLFFIYTALALPSKSLRSEGQSSQICDLHPFKIFQTKAVEMEESFFKVSTSNVANYQLPSLLSIHKQEMPYPPLLGRIVWFKASWKPTCINDPCTNRGQLRSRDCDFTPNTHSGLDRHTHSDTVFHFSHMAAFHLWNI